ncbi:MAG TPA: SAM-dependent chlorinase/fluorinase [Anaerolineales bacterium]|nr:SAM-dependent chlorinase/fluorinase [Anaerolineales bacterium]
MMRIITLLTDFGIDHEFVGIMKGVICAIAPDVQLVDLTHRIPPQSVRDGAMSLWRAYPFFPNGTIHLFVVDPGVGTKRRPLAAKIGGQYFVGPDNGLLTPIMEDAQRDNQPMEFVQLQDPKYWLKKVSHTFHGRDIFSPVVAHLANGVSLSEFGSFFTDPVRVEMPKPIRTDAGWQAHISAIDAFGNLTLDLPAAALQNRTGVLFRLHGVEVVGVVESYGHRSPGELVAVVDSEDFLELAEVNGNAARRLNAKTGDVVEVHLSG